MAIDFGSKMSQEYTGTAGPDLRNYGLRTIYGKCLEFSTSPHTISVKCCPREPVKKEPISGLRLSRKTPHCRSCRNSVKFTESLKFSTS